MDSSFGQRLASLEQRFRTTTDDAEDFEEDLARVPEMDAVGFEEFLTRRAATQFGALIQELRDFVLNELLPDFDRATPSERADLVSEIRKHTYCALEIWGLAEESCWRFMKAPRPDKERLLRLTLHTALLVEQYLQERPAVNLLRGLWLEAIDQGIDPRRHFAEAAQLAGTHPLSGGRSARELLRSFESEFIGP